MPKISIVVPVYKVEKYLDRCVKSILKQTYSDFELILVDDGSPDNCPVLCDEWERKDDRIKVIHKENGGLSSARNAGLEIACGEYIGFVDSDDWIDEKMYETLLTALLRNDADYAFSEMKVVKDENITYIQPQYEEKVLSQNELFKIFFRVDNKDIHYCACDKLIKKQILSNIRFWEGMRFEDIDFNFNVLMKCTKGVYVNQVTYYWFYNQEGITRNSLIPQDMQLLDIWKNICDICDQKLPQYSFYANMNRNRAYLGLLGKYVKYGVSKDFFMWSEEKKYLKKSLRKNFVQLFKWNMSFSRKILLILLCISPEFLSIPFYFYRKMVKK